MLIWVPKFRYSKAGIKANSAAASGKQALGSVILLLLEGKIQESWQGPSFCTIVQRALCGRENLPWVLCFNIQYSKKTFCFSGQAFLPPNSTTSCFCQRLIFGPSQGLQGISRRPRCQMPLPQEGKQNTFRRKLMLRDKIKLHPGICRVLWKAIASQKQTLSFFGR